MTSINAYDRVFKLIGKTGQQSKERITALATPTTQIKKSRKYLMICNDITSGKIPGNASVTGRKSWNFTGISACSNTVILPENSGKIETINKDKK
ncbi:MAG: hypothetical protein JXB88_26500 [Spirochaetales bacterium]|nr:hypothetical protein [Spirochaetales bacterium]